MIEHYNLQMQHTAIYIFFFSSAHEMFVTTIREHTLGLCSSTKRLATNFLPQQKYAKS
jgi:hypothetical protein